MSAPTLRGTDTAVNNGGSPNTITLETPPSTQAGDTVVVGHALNFIGNLNQMSEPGGDITDWELVEQGFGSDGAYLKVWIGHAASSGVNEVTLSTPPANDSSNYGLLRCYAGDVSVEDSAVASGTGGTSLAVGPVTPTSSESELVGFWTLIGFAATPYSITVPSSMSGTQVGVVDSSGFQPTVMGHETLSGTSSVSRTASASASAERGWVGVLVVLASTVPPQAIVDPTPIPAPPAPFQPTVKSVTRIRPNPIPAPPPPFEPTVIPGPVFITSPTPIPAPPAPFEPKVVQVVKPLTVPSSAQVFTPTVVPGIRPPLRVDFWAVDDDGSLLCPLPQPLSWDLSLEPGEPGAITLEYPVDGINFAVLDERVTTTRDLPIRIRTDGRHATSLGGLLQSRDGDEVAEQGVVRFYGKFNTWYLSEAVVAYNEDDERGETRFPNSTAGHIFNELLTAAQDRGTLTHLSWTFTATHDSRGVPWSTQTSAVFAPGRTYLEVAQQLRDWGMIEFEVTSDLEVALYEPSTVGVDHTLADPPIVLRRGRDLLEATRRLDISEAATDLLVAGDEGVYVSVHDDTARAQRGRQVERYVSEGNLADEGSATAFGLIELERVNHGADEVTHALTMDQNQPAPLRELMPLDWVFSDRGSGLERMRIMQVTVSQDSGDDHYKGSAVVGDLIDDADTRLARKLEGLAGGQIVAGVSEPGADVDDGLAPAVPEGLNLASAAYPVQDGTRATVTASWLPVTENEDGSQIRDLDRYELRYRYVTGDLPTDWLLAGVVDSNTTTMSWEGVVAGVGIEAQVQAWDRWGHGSGWSTSAFHTTEDDATPPPVPSAPTVTNYLGLLRVDWDGLGSAGESMPPDFDRVEILASETDDFDPDTDDYEQIGVFRAAGTYPWSPPGSLGSVDYGTEWFVKLRAVDKDGNTSAPSAQGSAIPGQVEDGDIAEVSIGKLTAGIMSALMTVSGIIRTAETGSRVELDSSGLYCIDSDDNVVFRYDIPNEILEMIGRFIAGSSATTGRRIVIDPTYTRAGVGGPFPTFLAYSESGVFGPGRINATDQPGGRTALGMNSGPSNATGDFIQSTVFLFPEQALMQVNTHDNERRGGYVELQENWSALGIAPSGTETAYIGLDSDSNIWLFGKFFDTAIADGDAYFAGERFVSSGFSGTNVSYGQTLSTVLLPIVTLDGNLCQWTVDNNTTSGFGVGWSGTDQHWVRWWCIRVHG